MNQKVAIFETEHFEVANPMIRLLDVPGNRLFIFTDHETYNRLYDLLGNDIKRYEWIVRPAGMSKRAFTWQLYKTCRKEKIQLLFLNTVTAHFMLYAWVAALLSSAKVILTLHDANNFLRSRFSLNPRITVRHIGKRALAHFCDAYITVSETVQQYLLNNMKVKKQVLCIPGAVFDKREDVIQKYNPPAPLRIVVPGSIDGKRRNYDEVFELLGKINQQLLPVTIVLAGGPYGAYGSDIISKCHTYALSHNNLVFYEIPVIDQVIFDKELDSCHFIWVPSVIKAVMADGIEETYGLTKSSGNIYDAIRHARPLLVPEGLTMPERLRSSITFYQSTDDLLRFLNAVIDSPPSYHHHAEEAFANATTYTIESMRDQLKAL